MRLDAKPKTYVWRRNLGQKVPVFAKGLWIQESRISEGIGEA